MGAWLAVGITARAVDTEATVGGGAFPSARIPSCALALSGDAVTLERSLRLGTVPVIGRIADGALLLDLRGVPAADDARLSAAVREALA